MWFKPISLRGVKPLRVDVHPVAILLYLVTKRLLWVPPSTLTCMLWLSGKGAEFLGGPNLSKGDSAFVRGSFPTAMVIMAIMRVLAEEFLC
jgi:hypothetical protein